MGIIRKLFTGNKRSGNWIDNYFDRVFNGVKSTSGIQVSEQNAMKLPAIWSAVNLIANDAAKIPFEVYKRNGADREPDLTHPAYGIVRWESNPEGEDSLSAFEFWKQQTAHLVLWRNSYSIIRRDGSGRPLGFLPLLPDRTRPIKIDGRRVYETEIDRKLFYFDAFDIFHMKGLSFDGEEGLKLCQFARDAIGLALSAQDFASKFFKNGGRLGGILELPTSMRKPSVDKIEEGFRKKYDSETAFQTVVLRENAKFHQAQATFDDTQLIESRQEDIREVGRLFNIPPHKLGDNSNNKTTLEQENKSYYDNCLSHYFEARKAEAYIKLLTRPQRKNNTHFFDFVIGALLWADTKTVGQIGSLGVRGGWLKPNEVRRWFNLPGDPNGDQLLIPSGMIPAGQQTEPQTENDTGNETETDTDENSDVRKAVAGLLLDARKRFVKRLHTHARKHCKNITAQNLIRWIDTDLDDHLPVGRSIFAHVQEALRAIGDPPTYHAGDIVEEFRHLAHAAIAAEPWENFPESLESIAAKLSAG